MQKNDVHFILIFWTHTMLSKFQILKFIYRYISSGCILPLSWLFVLTFPPWSNPYKNYTYEIENRSWTVLTGNIVCWHHSIFIFILASFPNIGSDWIPENSLIFQWWDCTSRGRLFFPWYNVDFISIATLLKHYWERAFALLIRLYSHWKMPSRLLICARSGFQCGISIN